MISEAVSIDAPRRRVEAHSHATRVITAVRAPTPTTSPAPWGLAYPVEFSPGDRGGLRVPGLGLREGLGRRAARTAGRLPRHSELLR